MLLMSSKTIIKLLKMCCFFKNFLIREKKSQTSRNSEWLYQAVMGLAYLGHHQNSTYLFFPQNSNSSEKEQISKKKVLLYIRLWSLPVFY